VGMCLGSGSLRMNSYLGEGQAVQDVRDAAAIPTQDHCAVTARMAGLDLHISGAV
jgi:hypothetical protein